MTMDDRDGSPRTDEQASVGFRNRVSTYQSSFSRFVATGGIIGIGTGIAAIMGWQDVKAWIIGIVVSGLSVLLAAVLWSARSL